MRRMTRDRGPRTVPSRHPGPSPRRSARAPCPHPLARSDRGVRVAAGGRARGRAALCRLLGGRLRLAGRGRPAQPVPPVHRAGGRAPHSLRPRALAPCRRHAAPHPARLAGLVLRVPQDRRDADPAGAPWRRARGCVPRRRPLSSRLHVLAGAARSRHAPGGDRGAHARADARGARLRALRGPGRRLGRGRRVGHGPAPSRVRRRPAPQHAGIPGEDRRRRTPPRRRGEGLARKGARGVRRGHGVLRHPGHPAHLARVWPQRLAGGSARVVPREVHRLDRLRRGPRERGHSRRVPDEPDPLLGDGQHRLRRADLL